MQVQFTYALPFMQTFLANRGLTEYHIYIATTSLFLRAFQENTHKSFIETVYDYIGEKYNKDIFYQGRSRDETNGDYICLHFKTEVAESIVKRIVEDIKIHYETHWIKHRIPSLFSTIQDQLQQPQYLANAISHFQECNGFNVTQQVIDIYFEQLI